jgi:hypothetical protein
MLMKALKENIEKFEARFGTINVDAPHEQHFGFAPVKKDEKVN